MPLLIPIQIARMQTFSRTIAHSEVRSYGIMVLTVVISHVTLIARTDKVHPSRT